VSTTVRVSRSRLRENRKRTPHRGTDNRVVEGSLQIVGFPLQPIETMLRLEEQLVNQF